MTDAPIERVLHSFGVPGELVEVHQLGGAWSNRVWSVRTTTHQYAVKELLNPWQDPHWREWLDESIAFERKAIGAGVRAPMPVLTVDGAALVDLDGRTFRAHHWIADAVPCPDGPVPTKLAALVARDLAIMHDLHATPSRADVFPQPTSATCDAWPDLIAQLRRIGSPYARMARGVAPEIACVGEWFAHRAPDANRVMSHGDIDQKNILLARGSAWLVDWDVAMPWRPEEEILRTALSLAVWRERPVVRRFFAAYRDAGGTTPEPAPEKFSLDLVIGIDWLDRCLRIASGMQDAEPQRIDEAHRQASQGLRTLPARVAIARNFPDWLATETP
jgi:aminoglycoside phosphotransferase (APT) family kinase protein